MVKSLFVVLSLVLSFSVVAENDPIAAQDSILEEVHILTNPVHNYHFGGACGFAGTPSKGSVAINNLIKRKAYKEIESVLDGRNIEGKLFAIVALLELADRELELKSSTKAKIKAIIEADFTFQRCQGCVITAPTTMALFKENKYAQLLRKNDIWVTQKSGNKLRLPSTF